MRGNVIHLTSNFTPFAVGESLRYHWRGGQADREETDDIIQRISLTEMRFLQRSQFDEIQYGSAMQSAMPAAIYCARLSPRTVISNCSASGFQR